MYLYELDSNSIDNDLKKTAKGIDQNNPERDLNNMDKNQGAAPGGLDGAPGTDAGFGGAPGLDQQQNMPDMGMAGSDIGPQDTTAQDVKKIDDAVISSVQGHPYVTNWRHRDDSKTNPYAIAQMSLDELYQLRKLAVAKMQKNTINNTIGSYDDEGSRYLNDLISFTDKVIDSKKQIAKTNDKSGKTAKFARKEPPKNEKPQQVKPKRPQ